MDNTILGQKNVLTQGYTNSEWEIFVKGELLAFMTANNIEKITVDDGCGKKARISRNKNGEYKVNITSAETM